MGIKKKINGLLWSTFWIKVPNISLPTALIVLEGITKLLLQSFSAQRNHQQKLPEKFQSKFSKAIDQWVRRREMVLRGENAKKKCSRNRSFSPTHTPPPCVFITQECFVRYVDITVEESKKLYAAPLTRVFLIQEGKSSCPASWSLPKVLKALPKLFGEIFSPSVQCSEFFGLKNGDRFTFKTLINDNSTSAQRLQLADKVAMFSFSADY